MVVRSATPSIRALVVAIACASCSESAAAPQSWSPGSECDEPAVAESLPVGISGNSHFCAVLKDGGVRCWGDWQGLQTPIGDVAVGRFDDGNPWRVPGAVCMRSIVVGLGSTCSIDREDIAHCWGGDDGEELGNGPGLQYEPHPVPVSSLPPIRLLCGGVARTAVGRDDGVVYQWGAVESSPSAPHQGTPSPFSGSFADVSSIGCEAYRCIVHGAGELDCWGRNNDGVLGDGTKLARDDPKPVVGIEGVQSIRATSRTACALLGTGEVWCWGFGAFGQLGQGVFEDSLVPVPVQGIDDAVDVAIGTIAACALHKDGHVSCWGTGAITGPNGPEHGTAFPVDVPGVENVVQIAATPDTVLALLGDGTLLWWGDGYFPPIGLDKFPRQVVWDEVLEEGE